ncbi:hypothetical protein GGE07_002924 [Sinorhizobium terangae]|nr:hypothetical protein [Sinorhizobium terangae]
MSVERPRGLEHAAQVRYSAGAAVDRPEAAEMFQVID